MVPIPQKMPPKYDEKIKIIFNSIKTGSEIYKDHSLNLAKNLMEDNVVSMLIGVVAEAD